MKNLAFLCAVAATLAAATAFADEPAEAKKPAVRVEHGPDGTVLRTQVGAFQTGAKDLDPRVLEAVLGTGSGEVFAADDGRNEAPAPR